MQEELKRKGILKPFIYGHFYLIHNAGQFLSDPLSYKISPVTGAPNLGYRRQGRKLCHLHSHKTNCFKNSATNIAKQDRIFLMPPRCVCYRHRPQSRSVCLIQIIILLIMVDVFKKNKGAGTGLLCCVAL